MDYIALKSPLDSIFLVFLALMGSVGFKLLGCPLQNLLHNNIWARQITYFIVILFTSSFLDNQGKTPPIIHLKNAFLIYLFLVIYTKMDVKFTVIVFFMILSVYIGHIYIRYYNNKISDKFTGDDKYYKSLILKINNANSIIAYSALVIVIFGFISFYINKKKQYGKKFNFIKFIFGTRLCKNK